ncbi:MAG: SH3 domain-containing protein [Anaerolineae bacterium]|nr:SH3 domain-containing protein [Anaerolineae bacterium]NUQ04379.1 SH3 domain-containing protein [Anaerolineae bacterium]
MMGTKTPLHFALMSLFILLLANCSSPTDQPPTPSNGGIRTGEGSSPVGSRVNIVIESVEIHQLPFDIIDGDAAQMQLIVFWSDGWLLDRHTSYFGNNAVTIHAGDVISDLGAGYVGFLPDQVEDEVYVWIIAVDSDDREMLVDVGAGLLLDEFGQQVEHWVERRIVQTTARTNIVSLVVSTMLDVLYSVVEQPDLIGQQAFLLLRDEGWNSGSYQLSTDDGGMTVHYRVEAVPAQSVAVVATSPPTTPPTLRATTRPTTTRLPQPTTNGSRWLNGTIDTARLNLRHLPSVDSYVVYRVSQYDRVRVIGRNASSDWALIDAGIVGWVNADYVVIEGDLSRLPLITSPSQYPESVLPISFVCPGANGPNFKIGDRFVVPYGDGPSGVFNEPGREPVVGRVPEGVGGRIMGAQVCADAPDNRYLIWYYVETDNGLKGYMNESYAETPIKAIVPD